MLSHAEESNSYLRLAGEVLVFTGVTLGRQSKLNEFLPGALNDVLRYHGEMAADNVEECHANGSRSWRHKLHGWDNSGACSLKEIDDGTESVARISWQVLFG